MKREPYFPRKLADRPPWYHNLALRILEFGVTPLGFDATTVNNRVKDCLFLGYTTGVWLEGARELGPAATSSLQILEHGTGTAPHELPVFTAPPLPSASAPLPAVVPVPPGALQRLFLFIAEVKAKPGYTEAIGLQMGIVGSEDTSGLLVPEFSLKVGGGPACECVRLSFKKGDHEGVVIYSKRGTGDWEMLGVDLSTPYLDERPLLVAGQPEVRQYRLKFYDNAAPTGDFSGILSANVGP